MIKKTVVTVIALFGAFVAFSCSGTSTTNTANSSSPANTGAVNRPAPVASPAVGDIAMGRKLYTDNCAKCHKDNGEGGVVEVDGKKIKADNLTDDKRKKLTDEKILKVMVDGIEDEGMPSFKDKMSEAEMREVVNFIRVELQKMPATPTSTSVSQ